MYRDNTKIIKIGDRVIGGGNPILIQSMTNTKTENTAATIAQIKELTDAGCDIVRCAVPNMEAAKALSEIKEKITMGGFKLIIEKRDGTKIWINPAYIIKMEKDLNDNYFIFLTTGDVFLISRSTARDVENYFQGRMNNV